MIETVDRPQFTIRELVWWTAAICIALALPGWIGEKSAIISFYGMLTFATWRLSKLVQQGCAFLIALLIAVMLTGPTIWIINR